MIGGGGDATYSEFLRAEDVQERYEADLLSKANVVGVGVGLRQRAGEITGEVALVVLVSKKIPATQLEPDDQIPETLEGVAVDVQEVGEIGALGKGG
jgi:hypothetical protein